MSRRLSFPSSTFTLAGTRELRARLVRRLKYPGGKKARAAAKRLARDFTPRRVKPLRDRSLRFTMTKVLLQERAKHGGKKARAAAESRLRRDFTIARGRRFYDWAWQFENANRHVAEDILLGGEEITGELPKKHNRLAGIRVSTVFLGVDHNFFGDGRRPIVFETMIFGGPHDGYQERYATWEEAEVGHRRALLLARNTSRKLS